MLQVREAPVLRILLVDDSPTSRKMVRNALERANPRCHDFYEASNGLEGLGHVDAWRPGLVISDWKMPEMSGLELLRGVRVRAGAPPFYFLTSEATEENRALAMAEGARGLIAKPFRHDALLRALEPVLT